MLTVRLDSPIPLGEQVARGIRRSIAVGELRRGDPLPPVRQLADDLGINFNTVARAYRELERQGLVASMRGRGTVVVSTSQAPHEPGRITEERLMAKVRDVLADARLAGLPRKSVERVISREVARFWAQKGQSR